MAFCLHRVLCFGEFRLCLSKLLLVQVQLLLELGQANIFLSAFLFQLGNHFGSRPAVLELLLQVRNCFLVCLILLS